MKPESESGVRELPAQDRPASARFTRWLDEPLSADAPTSNVAEPVPSTVPSGLQDVTIMMIDDEPLMTDAIEAYLDESGYRRFVAINDPLLAMDAMRRHRPGMVLLDLHMPGLSGFDLLKLIRTDAQLRYTPVIMLTAANNTATKLEALELGATEFLSKPVDASELLLRLRNSLVFKVYQDRLANEDLLTGLPNQRVFAEQLRFALADASAERTAMAMLHIGLDRFKQINDSLGYSVGDRVLEAIALRLQGCVRRSDTLLLSRLEGDEFGLLMPGITSPDAAEKMARRILAAMARPLQLDGRDLYVTPSIGISVYPDDGRDDAMLRRNAAAAMAHAKSSGRNTFEFYSAELNSASAERLALETSLRRAIDRNELLLHYQPKVDLHSGRVIGAEALLRWRRPGLGLLPPGQFVPIAEENGQIVEIDRWVIEAACAQLARWRDAGMAELKVAVNITRQDLVAGGLVQAVERALTRHRLAHGQLVLELTESMLMDRVDAMRGQLDSLRALGVELSIDDFGTGYSSMSYLKRFPLDELKIDKSFVDGVGTDPTDRAIIQALVVLARSLGMRTVAEGVETAVQRDALRELGCDACQGYLFSKPVAAELFAAKCVALDATAEPACGDPATAAWSGPLNNSA